jgi:hypothetical protein
MYRKEANPNLRQSLLYFLHQAAQVHAVARQHGGAHSSTDTRHNAVSRLCVQARRGFHQRIRAQREGQ